MDKAKKVIKIILWILVIYLVASGIYIIMHVDFRPAPEITGTGFSEQTNLIRKIMGLPPTYTTYEGVGPKYILYAVIRFFAALVLSAVLLRKQKVVIEKDKPIWKDRKRNFLGLPISFTEYSMTDNRLFIKRGLLNQKYDEVRLYRIRDNSLTKSLWQRITGTGTVHITSSDTTLGNFDLKNIADPESVNELLSKNVDEARRKNRVIAREDMSVTEHDDDEIDQEEFETEIDVADN